MLDDIFKALLEGAQSQSQTPQSAQPQAPFGGGQQDMLTQLLQGALQGQQPPPQANEPANLAGMSGLLGGLLGGMGGSSQNQANPIIAPIANMLAEKLDIPPSIASLVVSFALTALLARGKRQPRQIDTGLQEPAFDLDDIVDGDFAFSSGMAQQLSRQTGLSEDDAAQSLQEAILMLSQQSAAPTPTTLEPQPPASVDDLLNNLLDDLNTN